MSAVSAERKDFIAYPTNRVVGTVGNAEDGRAAIDALLQAGFHEEDIDILHGEEDLKRLDPSRVEEGFLAQFQRTLVRTVEPFEEFKYLTHHREDVRAGRFVIMVLAKRRLQRIVAADILNRHGAEFVGFYGRWAWERLPGAPQATPDEMPALFVRAWNDRNADALASLFDPDAEFVNRTGACWHDRESIRNAHARGVEGIFGKSTLALEEKKVRLLSPDLAVVHARMTLTCEPSAKAVAPTAPRATIVSFVVHRTADRWLCASAHITDVAGVPMNVIDEAGGAVRPIA
jgi:uncharacterized protein (TIGR02246 family)